MQTQPVVPDYSPAARIFHWLTAALILTIAPLGIAAVNAASKAEAGQLFFWHTSLGVIVFVVAVLRALYRLVHGAPGPHPQLSPLERSGSQIAYVLLYILILLVPFLGWLGTSAFGRPPSVFGLFTLPQLLATNRDLGRQIMTYHVITAFFLAGLVTVHIVAALYHGIVRRDGVLTRMVAGTDRGIGPA